MTAWLLVRSVGAPGAVTRGHLASQPDVVLLGHAEKERAVRVLLLADLGQLVAAAAHVAVHARHEVHRVLGILALRLRDRELAGGRGTRGPDQPDGAVAGLAVRGG